MWQCLYCPTSVSDLAGIPVTEWEQNSAARFQSLRKSLPRRVIRVETVTAYQWPLFWRKIFNKQIQLVTLSKDFGPCSVDWHFGPGIHQWQVETFWLPQDMTFNNNTGSNLVSNQNLHLFTRCLRLACVNYLYYSSLLALTTGHSLTIL